MEIVFYTAPMSSAVPVGTVLSELEVPHERVTFDLATGAQRRPEFRALNPNGKVPTLVVDGTPMFEALAIMHWLGDTFGVDRGVWPARDQPARLQALSWSTWAYATYGPVIGKLRLATHETMPESLRSPALAEHALSEAAALLQLLEDRLSARPHLLGETFSLSDIIVGSTVLYSSMVGVPLAPFSRVASWITRLQQRPSMRREWEG